TFSGLKYYVFDENPGSIYTYNADYSLANQIMNFNLYTVPNFYVKEKTRNVEFTYNSENYSLPISYNENLMNFYSSYPQCNIGLYFDAGVSELTKESLAKALWPIIHKMDEKEAVSFLLNMVQTGFEYQTDEEQFGAEKYFFPEEILYYPYSDCEDRAVFFAFLVNEYLQLPVISLCYPMHVATAVNFSDKTYGDFIKYKGDNYTVCDPTYINAPIGATMPQYKKSKIDIIAPEKRIHDDNQPIFVWERIYSAGGSRLGGSQDLVYLKDNSYVVAGFFKDSLSLGKTVYNTDKNTTGLFIAIYDKSDNLVFVNTLQAKGYIAPDGLTLDENSNIYVTGQFAGSMEYDKLNIKASSPDDQFVLKMNSNGKIDWLTAVKLDTVTLKKPYAFQCLLSEKGEIQGFMFVSDESLDENIKIYENEDNLIVIAASRGMSESGFTPTPDFESSSKFDLANTWKSIADHYIALRYNKNIAGFFALIETMEKSNLNVSGKEILATLNTLNPDFQKKYKGFYDQLQNLSKLSSKNGVVSFYTDKGKVVKCGPISITNGAQAQMRNYKSGNKQINTMKGIYYDTLFRSRDINYIKFFKVNGDLMIDYSKDHNQKVINTEKDILRL
ncbi:MAG: hypothetical protein GX879_03980, partial [Bacteroidales bacterium]|nr:hypothetical protein [Bacteroidales bacterium]